MNAGLPCYSIRAVIALLGFRLKNVNRNKQNKTKNKESKGKRKEKKKKKEKVGGKSGAFSRPCNK